MSQLWEYCCFWKDYKCTHKQTGHVYKQSVHPSRFGLFTCSPWVMIRQSIVWRSFFRQWPFNNVSCSWLASSKNSEIQTGAFVTKCSGLQWFLLDNSIVHMHTRPGSSPRSKAGVTQCIYYLRQRLPWLLFGWAVQPQQARYGCVIVRGYSRRLENKTGRPGFKWSSWATNTDSSAPIWREIGDGEVVVIKTKIISQLRCFCGCKEKQTSGSTGLWWQC